MTDPTPELGRTELRRRRQIRRRIAILAVVGLLVVTAGGIFFATRSDDSARATAHTTTLSQADAGLSTSFGTAPMRAATTKGGDIALYAAPDPAAQPIATLSPKTEYVFPRTVLAFDAFKDWLHVYLPTRPNDATAWVKASDVIVSQPLEYQVRVNLAEHTLTLLHNGAVVFQVPAAIGTDENPTPKGTFFFTDPLDLSSDPGGPYGVFAIGLSGHSNTLTDFAGGDGQIAIHGTNDPGTIGTSVSHGCVRVNNDVILKLAPLPIGTPVVIS